MRVAVIALACLLLAATAGTPTTGAQCQPACNAIIDMECKPYCDLIGVVPEMVLDALQGLCRPHC